MTDALLSDLARARAAFQLRAVTTAIGALILAEIGRLDRAEAGKEASHD